MDLIVFDLDGTLLNKRSQITRFTGNTLSMMRKRKIRYTIATGRTLHSAVNVIDGHYFNEPLVLKNGVLTYDPKIRRYTDSYLVDLSDVTIYNNILLDNGITPFIFTIEPNHDHAIYHREQLSKSEIEVLNIFGRQSSVPTRKGYEIPQDDKISNVSAIGQSLVINKICGSVNESDNLVAFSGPAIENSDLCWIDIHHSAGSKSRAVQILKNTLGVTRIICFGDSDNDLCLFSDADEAYAPANAKTKIKNAATAIIDHHNEDGVARFLRDRFDLS